MLLRNGPNESPTAAEKANSGEITGRGCNRQDRYFPRATGTDDLRAALSHRTGVQILTQKKTGPL